ncbi:MAG: MFS transporter [Nitrososphaerales archaeon]
MLESSAKLSAFAGVPSDVKSFITILSLNSIGISYLIIYLTAYLPETGFSSSIVGTIVGAQGIALVIAGVPLGILSDRRGRKWILILGSMGLPPILFTFALTSNVSYLIMVSILGGMAESGFLSTVNAIIADRTQPGNREAAFSLSFIFGTVSSGVGSSIPFAFPYLERVFGITSYAIHRDFLFFFGALSLIGPFAFLRLLKHYKEARSPAKHSLRGKHFRTLVKFSGANSLIGLGAGFIIPLIPTWFLLKFGVHDNYSGPLLALSSITMAFAAFLSPWLAKRFGIVKAIVINQGLSTIFMFSLAFAGDPLLAAGLYVVRATMMNVASPLSDSFLMSIISSEERGFASSLNSVIWRIPNSVTTIIGGVLLASGNYSLPFFLAGGFYIVSVSLFYYFFRGTKMIN